MDDGPGKCRVDESRGKMTPPVGPYPNLVTVLGKRELHQENVFSKLNGGRTSERLAHCWKRHGQESWASLHFVPRAIGQLHERGECKGADRSRRAVAG